MNKTKLVARYRWNKKHHRFWVHLIPGDKFCLVHHPLNWLQACQDDACPPSHLDGVVSDRGDNWGCYQRFYVHLIPRDKFCSVHQLLNWLQACQDAACPPSHLDGVVSDKGDNWGCYQRFWVYLIPRNKFCFVHHPLNWLQACQDAACPPSHLDGVVEDRRGWPWVPIIFSCYLWHNLSVSIEDSFNLSCFDVSGRGSRLLDLWRTNGTWVQWFSHLGCVKDGIEELSWEFDVRLLSQTVAQERWG